MKIIVKLQKLKEYRKGRENPKSNFPKYLSK